MSQPAPSSPAAEPAGSTPGAPAAAVAERTRKPFGRYRVMAFITGAFLLLLCVEMVLDYVLKLPWVDTYFGWVPFVHGWVYVVYIVTVFDLWSKARWTLGRLVVLVLGGVVPVLSFVVEKRAAAWPVESVRARRA
ncbi:DUF3817 domain-containing protein [Litorihabitans aurantiacus]|uniref:DUF3817 domain-containing protein n=1 Tax=Litorihabitans aurantiacus TaxID=1930061 RepID=A0AA37XFG2_9MICO|nr:DUF3817 domain-containing protein [Litorihabitans aurantiacus]GMA32220.1 hypothetical protein GCM10025875_22120 [Litorihabitans aurantiacus]